ncbi:unnamed protein product [Arctogadus glacialis]
MTFEQAEKFRFNPFDLIKVWSHKEYPLIPVGKLVLNRNPTNYFAEAELQTTSPTASVPPTASLASWSQSSRCPQT